MVSFEEIEKNELNLNIPRYIDSQQAEDIQDIEGHLRGGIPARDIAALEKYWNVCPNLQAALFRPARPGYSILTIPTERLKATIHDHPEFTTFIESMAALFANWRERSAVTLRALTPGCHPKAVIRDVAEYLLAHYTDKPLMDNYGVCQHLMDYWAATMQDDCYLIAANGWKAETYRVLERDKAGKEKDRGWTCDLVLKPLIVARYFVAEQARMIELEAEAERLAAQLAELEEENAGEGGAFYEWEKVNRANVMARLKELRGLFATDADANAEAVIMDDWLKLNKQEADAKKAAWDADAALDASALAKYPTLTEAEIKNLVVEDKWLTAIEEAARGEMERISQALTQRVKALAERYASALPERLCEAAELERRVNAHLTRMGFAWK